MPPSYTITYQAQIKQSLSSRLKIWLAWPQTNYLQKISQFELEPKEKHCYDDANNNRLAYWDINKKQFKLNLVFTYQNGFCQSQIEPKQITQIGLDPRFKRYYTKSEPFLEQTPLVQKLSRKIVSQKNPYQAALEIFTWVKENFSYCYPPLRRGVAQLDFNNLCGDCGEYSGLFVALCRNIGIPAKVDVGFCFYPRKQKFLEHAWASIYLQPYGWLPVDCQLASLAKTSVLTKSRYFCNIPDQRIIFTSGFNIPLKPSLSANDDASYWQKQGLPVNKKSVQTLQPLFFTTSAKKPELKLNQSFRAVKTNKK